MWEILCGILLVPHNSIMDLNNVMKWLVSNSKVENVSVTCSLANQYNKRVTNINRLILKTKKLKIHWIKNVNNNIYDHIPSKD